MKTIYVIFSYVDGEAINPTMYETLEKAEEAFNKKCDELKIKANNPNGIDEWEELGGKAIACMSEDTIYRLCALEIPDELTYAYTYAYIEYEDDKYHQLRQVGVDYLGVCRQELKGFIEEFARDEEMELVDAGMYSAKFRNNDLSRIHEGYVLKVLNCEEKTYKVNVHYDYMACVSVTATSEEEAIKIAKKMGDEMSVDELHLVKFTDACIVE